MNTYLRYIFVLMLLNFSAVLCRVEGSEFWRATICLSPDFNYALTCDGLNSVNIWDLSNKNKFENLSQLPQSSGATILGWRNNLALFQLNDNSIISWDLTDIHNPQVENYVSDTADILYNCAGSKYTYTSYYSRITRWDITDFNSPSFKDYNLPQPIYESVPFLFRSNTGDYLGEYLFDSKGQQYISVYDKDFNIKSSFYPINGLWDAIFSPDNKFIFIINGDLNVAYRSGTIEVWNISNLKNPQFVTVFETNQFPYCININSDGTVLITGSKCWDSGNIKDQTICVWDISNKSQPTLIKKMYDIDGYINSVCFSPDEKAVLWLNTKGNLKMVSFRSNLMYFYNINYNNSGVSIKLIKKINDENVTSVIAFDRFQESMLWVIGKTYAKDSVKICKFFREERSYEKDFLDFIDCNQQY